MAKTTHADNRSLTTRFTLLTILSVIGTIASILLSKTYYDMRGGSGGFKSFCNMGSSMNCDAVAASSYAELFSGIPLSSVTAGWYLAIFLIAFLGRSASKSVMSDSASWPREAVRATFLMFLFGSLYSIWLMIVMATKLNTWCLYCLILDGVNFAGLAVALSMKPQMPAKAPVDGSRWKTVITATLIAIFVMAVLLKSMDKTVAMKDSEVTEVVESVLNAAPVPVGDIPGLPSVGPANAPITIVEFIDFQCPHCKVGALTMNALRARYPDKVRLVLQNFPFDPACNRTVERAYHPVACQAAKISVCAEQQGKFTEVYEHLLEKQSELGSGKLLEFAAEAGADRAKLEECVNAPATHDLIVRGIEQGITAGVASTPTFFINGRKVEGAYPLPVWVKLIERL